MLEDLLNEASVLWSRVRDSRLHDAEPIRPSEGSKRFPGVHVGESLWRWDLDEGFERLVVVGKISEYCIVVSADNFCNKPVNKVWAQCAPNDCFATRREAVLSQASEELRYHNARVEHIRKLVAAAESGDDLSGFRGCQYEYEAALNGSANTEWVK